ncbi:MAG: hypothetical protein K2F81_05365 [Ruminococcus sp.]|nr:hypothetical protein [Ruminococcus sp.]
MKEKLIKLINVKSIVTIMMSLVFCLLSVYGKISSEQFMTVFATVIAFYFGTQHQKNSDGSESLTDNKTKETEQ